MRPELCYVGSRLFSPSCLQHNALHVAVLSIRQPNRSDGSAVVLSCKLLEPSLVTVPHRQATYFHHCNVNGTYRESAAQMVVGEGFALGVSNIVTYRRTRRVGFGAVRRKLRDIRLSREGCAVYRAVVGIQRSGQFDSRRAALMLCLVLCPTGTHNLHRANRLIHAPRSHHP